MNVLFESVIPYGLRQFPIHRLAPAAALWFGLGVALISTDACGQSSRSSEEAYVSATELLPRRTGGMVRIPNLPAFSESWDQTNLGRLLDEPAMQPFLDALHDRAKGYVHSPGKQVGLKLKDLREIATGEVVAAWLPFDTDKRRPFAVCVVADIRGSEQKTETVVAQIDADLKAGGSTRRDITHRGQTVRVYTTKPKPGQLKIDQIALTYNETRIIAADRDTVVTGLLNAIAGESVEEPLSHAPDFQTIMSQSRDAITKTVQEDHATLGLEWFARPFSMGRILREIFEVDRGDRVDILNLLENQGFDAIEAVGGVAALAGPRYDWLHRGLVLAPPTTDAASRYEKAARMLQPFNQPLGEIPEWVPESIASFTRLNWKLSDAFWASESLVNEAFGDEIFQPMVEGIREDEEGPQIDLKNEVLPALGEQLILLTDNTLPATVDSERMLVAIRVNDADAIAKAVRKAMEVEPDATKMDALPGVEIWRVQRGVDQEFEDFDEELFSDFGLEEDVQPAQQQRPLLDRWAIALVDQGPSSNAPYLIFSSHPELLVDAAERIQQAGAKGLGSVESVQAVLESMKQLGADEVAVDRVNRSELSLRAKYQLLRQGELRKSDSVLATLLRRVFDDQDGEEADQLDTSKLPPLKQIEHYLRPGGTFLKVTDKGFSMTGFFLK